MTNYSRVSLSEADELMAQAAGDSTLWETAGALHNGEKDEQAR